MSCRTCSGIHGGVQAHRHGLRIESAMTAWAAPYDKRPAASIARSAGYWSNMKKL